MADKKISELTATTTLGDTDVFPVVQGTVTKKVPFSVVKAGLGSSFTDLNADNAEITTAIINSLSITQFNLGLTQDIDTTDAIDFVNTVTRCTNTLGTPYNVTLGLGDQPGQIHIVLFEALQVTLQTTVGKNWTSIVPTSSLASVTLLFINGTWSILTSHLVTIT